MHDRTGLTEVVERDFQLSAFPTLADLWPLYQQWRGLTAPEAIKLVEQPYYTDGTGKEPLDYQRVAINRAIEAIAKGQQRVLLVMATGTGKTYTAFQIIGRLWKGKAKKRILFLADRNILVDQTMQQDFAPFCEVMRKIKNREVEKKLRDLSLLSTRQSPEKKSGSKYTASSRPISLNSLLSTSAIAVVRPTTLPGAKFSTTSAAPRT